MNQSLVLTCSFLFLLLAATLPLLIMKKVFQSKITKSSKVVPPLFDINRLLKMVYWVIQLRRFGVLVLSLPTYTPEI